MTLISILCFINVGIYAGLLGLSIIGPGTLRSLFVALPPGGSGPVLLLKLGPALRIYFAAITVITGIIGFGMLRLKNWARWVMSIFAAATFLGSLYILVTLAGHFNLSALLLSLPRIGVSLLLFWYPCTPGVRAAFRRPKAEPAL